MRKASENYGLIKDSNGTFVGVAMGHDYCAEHEWGIREIKNYLGITRSIPALYEPEMKSFWFRRKVWRSGGWKNKLIKNSVPICSGSMADTSGNTWFYLCITSLGSYFQNESHLVPRIIRTFPNGNNPDVRTAWDEKEFCIWFKDEDKQIELADAFHNKNIMITSIKDGSDNFNMNSGYAILIASKTPQSFRNNIDLEDKLLIKKQKEAWATGIYRKIPKTMYMALSPLYDTETKELIFWLNPNEQDLFNSGWYTVEQLLEWLEGKGPIPYKNRFKPGDKRKTYIKNKDIECTVEEIISDTTARLSYIDPKTKKKKTIIKQLRYL